MKLGVWLFLAAATFARPLPAVPADKTPSNVHRFEQKYRDAHTLKADFLERYLENGKEMRSEAGVAYFSRPGKMRWEYQRPEPNLFVIDGKWSWFYVPADHTATRIRARDSADWRTPLALLAGEMKISRVCQRVEPDASQHPLNPNGALFRCLLRGMPKQAEQSAGDASALLDSPGTSAVFELDVSTGELLRILAVDPGGVEIEFRFANWQFDPPVEAAKFHFAPPRGVAIIDGDLPGLRSTKGETAAANSALRKSN